MSSTLTFTPEALSINAAETEEKIEAAIRDIVFHRLRRKGVVIGLSGGVDSSTAAALCVRALGPERVFGLFMPEADSSGDSAELGRELAEWLGIQSELENISPALEAIGCYRRRDEAIRRIFPNYDSSYKSKIVLADVLGSAAYPIFSMVVQAPDGVQTRARLTLEAYLSVVAATNFKQRIRKTMEYYYADRLNYAVIGTPNRLEYDQGFFVKNGDGAADLKPIAHLYKTQVYQLAEHLGVPESIRSRPPTTDTYSLEQSQEEFFFLLPYQQMDLCLYAKDHNVPPEDVAPSVGLSPEQAKRVYRMIDSKRQAARYLHAPPALIEEVE